MTHPGCEPLDSALSWICELAIPSAGWWQESFRHGATLSSLRRGRGLFILMEVDRRGQGGAAWLPGGHVPRGSLQGASLPGLPPKQDLPIGLLKTKAF